MRIILYTGKGGVGKTSVAAATACKIAGNGQKVMIMSTDQAHSLGDSLDHPLGNEPVMIRHNLYGMEIDTVMESEKAWGGLKDYIKKLLTSKTGESIEAEELLVFPGFEELFSLFKIMEIYEKGEYDALIVDCAPTGETMSLLRFPEMIEVWISRVLPLKRKALKVAGPLVERTLKIPMLEDNIFDEVESLCKKLENLRELMSNKDIVSIRIVTTPEKIVVKESKRNFSYLHLYDYNVDAVIVNKIYPKASLDGYFNQWIANQENSMQDITESFTGIPILSMEFMKNELRTVERLEQAARMIYGEINPMEVLFRDTIFTVDKVEGTYWLRIVLPFVDKKDLELVQKGEELSLSIKNQHRNFILPSKIKDKQVTGAKYEDGKLNISF